MEALAAAVEGEAAAHAAMVRRVALVLLAVMVRAAAVVVGQAEDQAELQAGILMPARIRAAAVVPEETMQAEAAAARGVLGTRAVRAVHQMPRAQVVVAAVVAPAHLQQHNSMVLPAVRGVWPQRGTPHTDPALAAAAALPPAVLLRGRKLAETAARAVRTARVVEVGGLE